MTAAHPAAHAAPRSVRRPLPRLLRCVRFGRRAARALASRALAPVRALSPALAAPLTAALLAAALVAAPALTPDAAAAARPGPAVAQRWAVAMLGLLNSERRAHHLVPLRMNARLARAAHQHDLVMARDNRMSHRLPGERYFAVRISATGYKWWSAGENIGWSSTISLGGLATLEREMYGERAPADGHRQNILNRSFRQVGIDVHLDWAHHKMWFTQDFGQPA